MQFSEYKDIFVYIEHRNNLIEHVSYELLAEAQKLVQSKPQLNFKVVAVLLGTNLNKYTEQLIACGADMVITCENEAFETYTTLDHTNALCQIIDAYKPDSFLIGATTLGRDLAPRVAARCNTGLTADATMIEMEEGDSSLLLVTRPAFGGNLYGTIICPDHRPQMATIRPNVFQQNKPDANRTGIIESFTCELQNSQQNLQVLEIIEKVSKELDISKAHIIVAAGRGVEKHFDLVQDVAKALGGVAAASRATVDAGFAPKAVQVGQTGKTVRPNLYIACGISGAAQHLAGMDKSDFIIAINKDPEAPIFSVANVGIVGDAVKILPILKEQLLSTI